MQIDPEYDAVGLIRYEGVIHIYCMPRWAWVLDGDKWNAAWIAAGHPADDFGERGGISVLDERSVGGFLASTSRFELGIDELRAQLLSHLGKTDNWWDVEHLFPKLFVDFDRRELLACYGFEGHPIYERYVPPGWHGDVVNFLATTFPEDLIAVKIRYWIADGETLLDRFRA